MLFHKTNELIICWTNKPSVDQKINILKNRILRIIDVMFTLITREQCLTNQDIPFFKEIIQNIACDLTLIIDRKFKDIENIPLNCEKRDQEQTLKLEYSQYIYQCLSILSKFSHSKAKCPNALPLEYPSDGISSLIVNSISVFVFSSNKY